MKKRVERPGVSAGYDLWSETYDQTPNSLVALDRRHTMNILAPQRGARVLDVAYGTGSHLKTMMRAGARPIGLDFSRAMLRVARRQCPETPLVYADLETELPFPHEDFDAVLCALAGEHLADLGEFFGQARAALKPGGKLVFSVFHPELVMAGVEANFEQADVEYRLGAIRHKVTDYLEGVANAGFQQINAREFRVDADLVKEVPAAAKHLHRPLLLVIEGWRSN